MMYDVMVAKLQAKTLTFSFFILNEGLKMKLYMHFKVLFWSIRKNSIKVFFI